MRDILFRGKRIIEPVKIERCAPDGWVYGGLIRSAAEKYILPYDISGEMYINKPYRFRANDFDCSVMLAQVNEKTIGLWTGLRDKNGKMIFEGDILQGSDYPFQNGDGEHNYYAEVVWFENSPALGFVTRKNPKSSVRGISDGNCDYIEDFSGYRWEVIGNIHDNPELLNGK